MTTPEDDLPLPPQALFLKRLVLTLTIVMIAGFVLLIATLVIKLGATPPVMPAEIALPEGVHATAFTQGGDWYAVVTDADQILIFDRMSGTLRQSVAVIPAN